MKHDTDISLRHLGPRPQHDPQHTVKISVRDLSFWYGDKQALHDVSLEIYKNEVTALLGPSGCGKTTLLKCLNRTNEIIPHTRMEGLVLVDGENIYDPSFDPPDIRRRFGWIAQKPDPFPRSIRDNILYAPHIHGLTHSLHHDEEVLEHSLERAGLWDEVKDMLDKSAYELSTGQQQRLCIARAIATTPEVILMDEPCSALDPISTAHVEQLIDELRDHFTVVIITHNLQQAARIAQRTAFFHLGDLVEQGDTRDIFLTPQTKLCSDYVTGRYG